MTMLEKTRSPFPAAIPRVGYNYAPQGHSRSLILVAI